MKTILPSNIICLSQIWTSSANRLAEWLFDGNYNDQMNTYPATPANTMSFVTNGYVNQALQFVSSSNQMLTVSYIPLSSTSFTVDMWLYITGLGSSNQNALFGLCPQAAQFQCLHLSIRLGNSNNYYLHFGFYTADCEGITPLPLNTWIHAAFVFDLTTLTQYIYLNGVLENSCIQGSALTATPTSVMIGGLPILNFLYFQVNDFQSNS
jgi:hypothetical protein